MIMIAATTGYDNGGSPPTVSDDEKVLVLIDEDYNSGEMKFKGN